MRPAGGEGASCGPLSWPPALCCSREYQGARIQLRRILALEEWSPTLLNTNFSCVFADLDQTAQRHVILAQLWVRNLRRKVSTDRRSGLGSKGWARPRVASRYCPLFPKWDSGRGGMA